MKKDKYEELGCEFINEAECKEEAEEKGLTIEDLEEEHFQDRKDGYILEEE